MKNCSDVIHEFEKRQGRLENAHSSIQQRIEQCGRLSDGVGKSEIRRLLDYSSNKFRLLQSWASSRTKISEC